MAKLEQLTRGAAIRGHFDRLLSHGCRRQVVWLSSHRTDGEETSLRYARQSFRREPDFGVEIVNYNLTELLERWEAPA